MNDSTRPLPVGVAEYAISSDERPLRTSGVGSCGVVVVHDERAGVSGLLHFMLPTAGRRADRDPDAKFADSGIEALLEAFEDAGGSRTRAWAKLVGGAKMLDFDSFDRPIGDRNVEAARDALAAHDVPIRGDDVGGDAGRMVTFEPETGSVRVKTATGERRDV